MITAIEERYKFTSIFHEEMNSFLKLLSSYSRSTYEDYIYTLKNLDDYINSSGLQEKILSEELISNWLKTHNVQSATKNSRIGHVRKFSQYLNALEIHAFEPVRIRTSSNYKAYTFTEKEFEAIICEADNYCTNGRKTNGQYLFPILLRILYGCGLRISEALALRWQDVNLETGVITIRESKFHKQRRVPMHVSLTNLLQLLHTKQIEEKGNYGGFLFESPYCPGKPYKYSTFEYWFSKILDFAGIYNERKHPNERGICPHVLRHYFTFRSFQQALREGLSLEETLPYLSEFLGHESFFGTEKYVTADYTLYVDSHKRMNDYIGGIFPEVNFEETE